MLNIIRKRFALSNKGAKDFVIGALWTMVQDISLMLPVVYMFSFLEDRLSTVFDSSANPSHGLWYYVLLGISFMLIMFMIAIVQYRNTYTTVYEESANRRISLAEKLRRLPLAFFGEKNLSDLSSTIMEDCTDLEHTFSHAVPQLFASILGIALMAIGLFVYNWQLSLALFWVVPFAAVVILVSKKIQKREFLAGYKIKREVTEHIQEGLETIGEIQSYQQEAAYLGTVNETIDRYEKQLIKGELFVGALVNTSQSLLKLGLVSVIIVGANLLIAQSIDLFTYLVFLLVASRIYVPMGEVFNNLAALFFLDIRINRMNEMEELPIQQGRTQFNPKHYTIEFDHAFFSYEEGKPVISDVSFVAKQGEITALVGPSGGGKSTCAKLSARFWDCDKGTIRLGGYDISTIDPETLLKQFSVVFQDVVLFNTSVMENIRIGRREATDEQVMQAAQLAQCDEFIKIMPQGIHTVIGENGETLSGGERQRISIARALLKDAPIVLLDEATASLDVENETKIQAAISSLIQDKTVLIIAHRMRTVAKADHIVVLEGGAVAEQGAHKRLLANNGTYARMWNLQQQSTVWNI
ncbi:ABC transporter ATP-binding protein [uncultured Sphaerochaeta sp.]|uniref:ABC transporter ATP-binding protein n=1 Tax=uncultured Sphaerochaeta sp. TaxID=886478 RepID=UPI002A0A646F|nr:ABC transporter ATP-binding protein [uncultured Sphaerochaeta sp.]